MNYIQIVNFVLSCLAAVGWIFVAFIVGDFVLPQYIKAFLIVWAVLMSCKNAFSGYRAFKNDKAKKKEAEWVNEL